MKATHVFLVRAYADVWATNGWHDFSNNIRSSNTHVWMLELHEFLALKYFKGIYKKLLRILSFQDQPCQAIHNIYFIGFLSLHEIRIVFHLQLTKYLEIDYKIILHINCNPKPYSSSCFI